MYNTPRDNINYVNARMPGMQMLVGQATQVGWWVLDVDLAPMKI